MLHFPNSRGSKCSRQIRLGELLFELSKLFYAALSQLFLLPLHQSFELLFLQIHLSNCELLVMRAQKLL